VAREVEGTAWAKCGSTGRKNDILATKVDEREWREGKRKLIIAFGICKVDFRELSFATFYIPRRSAEIKAIVENDSRKEEVQKKIARK